MVLLGPRFKSNALRLKNDSPRYPYSQHRSDIKSEAASTAGQDDKKSARNSYKPPMSQPFFNLDGMVIEPFVPAVTPLQHGSMPALHRTSEGSDSETSSPHTSAFPDGLTQLSRGRTISTPMNSEWSHTSPPKVTTSIGYAKNKTNENSCGNRAVSHEDSVTHDSNNMSGIQTRSMPSGELVDDDEDNVPLQVLKEQARRSQSHATEQLRGSSIDKPENRSPEIVISHPDEREKGTSKRLFITVTYSSFSLDITSLNDAASSPDRDTSIVLQHFQREVPQPLALPDIGPASSLTSLRTLDTDSTSPGPSFTYIPNSSTLSSPFPAPSRPKPKIVLPVTSPRLSRRISMQDKDGNLCSLRFSPTIVTRHPTLPLKLPTLPPLLPTVGTNVGQNPDKQKRENRARIRSMPALPRSGVGRGVGGHEEEDHEDDMDDTIDEEGDDDILGGEEEGRALSRIDRSDARSSSSAGSDCSMRRTPSYATAQGEAGQEQGQEHVQEIDNRGTMGEFLPRVDTTKLDLSFLETPPTPLLETRKGKARDVDAATPTERLQRDYFSSIAGGTAHASSSTLVSNKRSTMYQTRPLSLARTRSSMMPYHTPIPGFATLKTLPLPPLADAERPGMYKHASQSMIDVNLKSHAEVPPLPVNDGESEMDKDGGGLTEPAENKGKEKRLSKVSLGEEPPSPKILRRRRSMPSYYGPTSPPPPYPTFAPFPRRPLIQPREDEGMERLPPYNNDIYLKAILPRKMEFSKPGVQAKDRKWRRVICVLEGTMFRVYRCPASVAGVSAIEGWWERKVGVGDVSNSTSPHITATTIIHGPSARSAEESSDNQNKEKPRNQSRATITMTPKTEPTKRSRLAVPFFKSVKAHVRSRSESSHEVLQGSMNRTRTHGGSLSSRAPSPAVMSSAGSTWSSNGTLPSVSRSSTRDSVPEPDPSDLIKTYSLQRAECGLGLDYTKRKNVIRVKMDGEQFLVQTTEPMEVVAWIEGIQTGTNVALDLDERVMPRGPLFPRWVKSCNYKAALTKGQAEETATSSSDVDRLSSKSSHGVIRTAVASIQKIGFITSALTSTPTPLIPTTTHFPFYFPLQSLHNST